VQRPLALDQLDQPLLVDGDQVGCAVGHRGLLTIGLIRAGGVPAAAPLSPCRAGRAPLVISAPDLRQPVQAAAARRGNHPLRVTHEGPAAATVDRTRPPAVPPPRTERT